MVVPRVKAVVAGARSISRLSIIIPTYGDIEQVEHLVRVLQPLRSQGVELLVANGFAAEADRAAELLGFVDQLVECSPGRARQMNAAAARAGGEFLLFLHADSVVSLSLFTPFLLATPADGNWGFFRLIISPAYGLMPLVAKLINWRSAFTSIATGDQALWVRRSLFEQLGAYPDQPLMEDIALCARLRQQYKPTQFPGFVETSARRWQKNGQLKTILTMWWLRLQYWLGVDPKKLAATYYPHLKQSED